MALNGIIQGMIRKQQWVVIRSSFPELCISAQSLQSHSLWPKLCGLLPTRLLSPMGFSRQEYWSGLACPPPRDLPDPGTEPSSPALQVDSLSLSHQGRLPELYKILRKF